jgi:hypothetical protein
MKKTLMKRKNKQPRFSHKSSKIMGSRVLGSSNYGVLRFFSYGQQCIYMVEGCWNPISLGGKLWMVFKDWASHEWLEFVALHKFFEHK